MRTSAQIVASALAASMALSACSQSKTPPPPPPPPALPKIHFNYPIKACPPGTGPATQNYTITLGPNFKLTNPVVMMGGYPQGTHTHPHPTRLDVVTNLLHANTVGSVTIILAANSGLHFAEHDLTKVPQDLAFEGADTAATQIFCDVTYASGPESLTFKVLPNSNYPYASYILGLVAEDKPSPPPPVPTPDPYTLPIFIDPGVDNQG